MKCLGESHIHPCLWFIDSGPLGALHVVPPFDHCLRIDQWMSQLHSHEVLGYLGIYVDDLVIPANVSSMTLDCRCSKNVWEASTPEHLGPDPDGVLALRFVWMSVEPIELGMSEQAAAHCWWFSCCWVTGGGGCADGTVHCGTQWWVVAHHVGIPLGSPSTDVASISFMGMAAFTVGTEAHVDVGRFVPEALSALCHRHSQYLRSLRRINFSAIGKSRIFLYGLEFLDLKFPKAPRAHPNPGTSRSKTRDTRPVHEFKLQKKVPCMKFFPESGISRRLGPQCPRNILPKNFLFRLFFLS